MARAVTAVENNFTKGLVTEYTGLNFPENAATFSDNVEFTVIGDVVRRLGMDFEDGFAMTPVDRTGKAVSAYKWNNAGGDGTQQFVVEQVGPTLFFYDVDAATVASPLSTKKIASTVDISAFVSTGGVFDQTIPAEFTDGNGYLFVFHPTCDPIYCSFDGVSVTGSAINVK